MFLLVEAKKYNTKIIIDKSKAPPKNEGKTIVAKSTRDLTICISTLFNIIIS
jgi:hypothetical protein